MSVSATLATSRYTAPANPRELDARIAELSNHYTPYLRSHPENLRIRQETVIDKGWEFRFEAKDVPKDTKRPKAPACYEEKVGSGDWEPATVPQWRYLRGKTGTVLGGKDVFGWGERKEHSNIAWYRTTFQAAKPASGRRLWLCFDAVDWEAEVYLNGELLGIHRVYYEPFRFDVTDRIRKENTLAVRIVDGRVFGEPHAFWTPLPDARAGEQLYVRTAENSLKGVLPIGYHGGNGFGILREVRLEETGDVLVSAVFARHDLSDDTARVKVEIDGTRAGKYGLRLDVLPENFDGRAYSKSTVLELPPGESARKLTIPMPEVKLWSPDAPHLYRCRVTVLRARKIVDAKDILFGCRSFALHHSGPPVAGREGPSRVYAFKPSKAAGLANGMLLLNGKPCYLRGTNVHGLNAYWYWGHRDKLINALLLLKAANFHVVRVCQHLQFPEVRELLDRMGMMSEQDQGSGYRHQKNGLEPHIMEQLVHTGTVAARETYNNPGVVLLTFGNECHFDATEVVKAVLAVDPQRIVKPISGRLSHGGQGKALLSDDALWANVIDDTHTYSGWYGSRDPATWRMAFPQGRAAW